MAKSGNSSIRVKACFSCDLFSNKMGEVAVFAVADASTAHIARMVSKQRSKKPVRGKAKRGNYLRPVSYQVTIFIRKKGHTVREHVTEKYVRKHCCPNSV